MQNGVHTLVIDLRMTITPNAQNSIPIFSVPVHPELMRLRKVGENNWAVPPQRLIVK